MRPHTLNPTTGARARTWTLYNTFVLPERNMGKTGGKRCTHWEPPTKVKRNTEYSNAKQSWKAEKDMRSKYFAQIPVTITSSGYYVLDEYILYTTFSQLYLPLLSSHLLKHLLLIFAPLAHTLSAWCMLQYSVARLLAAATTQIMHHTFAARAHTLQKGSTRYPVTNYMRHTPTKTYTTTL